MTEQQERKQHIRKFMQLHYTDERLAQLLAHAQSGKLAYISCCCFIGIPTADHALRGEYLFVGSEPHYQKAYVLLLGANSAEEAFCDLGGKSDNRPQVRIRILVPMIRAEMKRRELLRSGRELGVVREEVAQ